MVIIKTKNGEFKYKDWQWNLAWLIVFLCGVAAGILGGLYVFGLGEGGEFNHKSLIE